MLFISFSWPVIDPHQMGVMSVCVVAAVAVAMFLIFNIQLFNRRRRVRRLTQVKSSDWTIYLHEMCNTKELVVLKIDSEGNPVASAKYHRLVKGKYQKTPEEIVEPAFIKEDEINQIRTEIKMAFETIFNGRPVTDPGNSNIYIIKK
jgi:hypothetical protein